MYPLRFLRCLALLLAGLATLPNAHAADEDPERVAITRTLTDYLDGSADARPEQLRRAFHPDARLLLSRPGAAYWPVSVDEYVVVRLAEHFGLPRLVPNFTQSKWTQLVAENPSGMVRVEIAGRLLDVVFRAPPSPQSRNIDGDTGSTPVREDPEQTAAPAPQPH